MRVPRPKEGAKRVGKDVREGGDGGVFIYPQLSDIGVSGYQGIRVSDVGFPKCRSALQPVALASYCTLTLLYG